MPCAVMGGEPTSTPTIPLPFGRGKSWSPLPRPTRGLPMLKSKKVDQFVKQNTTDRFGPVRQVKPELVFEIAFEGIAASSRHRVE